jgi:hypothetical protein
MLSGNDKKMRHAAGNAVVWEFGSLGVWVQNGAFLRNAGNYQAVTQKHCTLLLRVCNFILFDCILR